MIPKGTPVSYWKTRKPLNTLRVFTYPYLRFARRLAPSRLAQDMYLKDVLTRLWRESGNKEIRILDLGCGVGQIHAQDPRFRFSGLDIAGFPREQALAKGYTEARSYSGEALIPQEPEWMQFDVVLISQVNAHVPFDLLENFIRSGASRLSASGVTILIAELDSHGLMYSIMKRFSATRFRRYVEWMGHDFFESESEFRAKLATLGTVENRTGLIGQILPLVHLWAYFFGGYPERWLRVPAALVDSLLSQFDRASLGLGARENRSFLVGFELKVAQIDK